MTNFIKNLLIGIVVVLGLGYSINFFVKPQYVANNYSPPAIQKEISMDENKFKPVDITEVEKVVVAEDIPAQQTIVQENIGATDPIVEIIGSLFDEMLPEKPVEKIVEKESAPQISFAEINTLARGALVNIVCTAKSGGSLNSITGSGIVISPKGIILTNAHVAQYYLLRDYGFDGYIDCVIRTGSPAKITYRAEPLYISEAWILDNAHNLVEFNPKGTGENDYAFLAITESAQSGVSLPSSFPYVPLTPGGTLGSGDNVFIGGYPAGFLSSFFVQKDLNITSTIGQIADIFTFGIGTADLITVDGSILSQKGASGGAVIDDKGDVIGLVVTSTQADSTADRMLGAITAGHIQISLLQQTGSGASKILNTNIAEQINTFKNKTALPLEKALFGVLKRE